MSSQRDWKTHNSTNIQPARARAGTALLGYLAACAIVLTGATSAAAQECNLSPGGACSKTSQASLKACRNNARGDYWTGIGRCRNESEDRNDCVADTRDERSENREVCVAQCSARQDVCQDVGQDPYDPIIDPADFMEPSEIAAAPNPYWPLVPGTEWVYEADDETITVTVLSDTIEILGVNCVTVRDVVEEDGVIIEDTLDWYAQDTDGNVWYFGEIAKNFEDGLLVDLDGSWRAGVDDAKAGIIMFADPQVGTVYRQEFLLGEAEDIGEILSLTGNESAPGSSCNGACVVTADYTPLEPGTLEHKYYAPGVGLVVEVKPGTDERLELASFTQP